MLGLFQNARISTRLIVGFGAILMLFVAITAFGIWQVNKVNSALTAINDLNSVKQRYAINFRGSVHDRAISLRDVVLVGNDAEFQEAVAEIKRLEEFYAKSAGPLDELLAGAGAGDPRETEILNEIKEIEKETMPLIKAAVDARAAGDTDGAYRILMNDARPLFVDWLAAINKFIDHEEAKNQAEAKTATSIASGFQTTMIAACIASLIIGASFAAWAISSIRPLRKLTDAMLKLADGNLDTEIPAATSKDEVADITGAVVIFKENAVRARQLDRDKEQAQQSRLQGAERVTGAITQFEHRIEEVKKTLVNAVDVLNQTSMQLGSSVQQTLGVSEDVAKTAQYASNNVQAVAAAASQLSNSIQEISTNVQDTAAQAQSCANAAEISKDKLNNLNDAVSEIVSIIGGINQVAEQTNLLALNATIEAARAGEAGKGFAVVANEVKSLATQTHKMTADIASKVDLVTRSAQETIESMTAIVNSISMVNEKTMSVAAAVEQQNSSTKEIGRSVNDAAHGTEQVSTNIFRIREVAENSAQSTNDLRQSANALEDQIRSINNAVEQFLREVRAA